MTTRAGRRVDRPALDPDVAVPDGLAAAVVLDADEALREVTHRVGAGEVVHQRAVQEHLDVLALDLDLVRVPLAERLQRAPRPAAVRTLEGVDRAGRAVREVGRVDLDLVALVDRDVRVVARVREADEDAAVVVLDELPVQLEAVVGELLARCTRGGRGRPRCGCVQSAWRPNEPGPASRQLVRLSSVPSKRPV